MNEINQTGSMAGASPAPVQQNPHLDENYRNKFEFPVTEHAHTSESVYDASARQRYEFQVEDGGLIYDTAHHYAPLDDERYIAFLNAIKVKGDEEQSDDHQIEATAQLWDDLVFEVENIEKEGIDNWKTLISYTEKRDSLTKFLAVAVVDGEKKASGKRQLVGAQTETVATEAYFNGVPCRQTHELDKNPAKMKEWQKKYDRIQAKRFRVEPTKGLRRKPQIEYVPQDEKIGALYDEMFVAQTGFKNGVVPLRFKTLVVHYRFGSVLDEKK